MICDVAVVGGGPAGSAAAITLARAGLQVVLLDKAAFPRDKTCGDGLTAGALRLARHLGVRAESVESWQPVHDVVVRSPLGREVTYPLPRDRGTFAAIARRRDFDAALLDRARAEGVKVHDGHAATHGSWDPARGAVDVQASDLGTVSARYSVAADGMWSPMRKWLLGSEEERYLGEWHGFRQYFAGVTGRAAEDLIVWFEPDLLPGYAWAFPLPGGRANVGFGVLRSAGRPTKWMKEAWVEILERPHVRDALGPGAAAEAPHAAWPIPARLGTTALTAAGGRVLFAGDAARATDPMTGEGIGQALETGVLAAQAILGAGESHPGRAAFAYEESLRPMALDHRLAAWLSAVLAKPAGADWSIRIAGLTPWTRRNFARWLFEDYPRAALATPSRWPLVFRPGREAGRAPAPQ
ncbi:MAG: NAD(P)/FAD-dependent oxidoreductase [Acidimicrobiia bacterium]